MNGKVYLIGAGPGNLELMTIKARKLIEQCDCLIYDRLVDPEVLNFVSDSCETIYVGKANRHHTMKQEEINQLLVDKANENKMVVRLKGGDVYVFGRGGEEGIYLYDNNIPFEVVPGLSSSIAGLAYAGIPITHRGVATGFQVVTAHNKQDELADIDFEAMARTDNTCVFLMGLNKVNEIVENLIRCGKNPLTPIALISNATLPNQKVLVSTLSNVIDEFNKNPLPSPCLIVVGDVIKLRNKLNFFENKPLFNTNILLPKVGKNSSVLATKLRALGSNLKEVYVAEIIEKKHAIKNIKLSDYSYIIFGSKNAIDIFFKQLKEENVDIRSLCNIKFVCVGEKTKQLLFEKYGIVADIVPTKYNSNELFEVLTSKISSNDKILFPRVENLNMELIEKLKNITLVDELALYKNEEIKNPFTNIENINFDYVIFNCASAVDYTFKYLRKELFKETTIISIGPKTSEALRKYNIDSFIESKVSTFDGVLETLLEDKGVESNV